MPAPTADTFQVSFPEFSEVTDALITLKLAEATAMLSADAFGTDDLFWMAVSYRAAHILAISPYGKQLQLTNDGNKTTYSEFFDNYILPRIARRGMVL